MAPTVLTTLYIFFRMPKKPTTLKNEIKPTTMENYVKFIYLVANQNGGQLQLGLCFQNMETNVFIQCVYVRESSAFWKLTSPIKLEAMGEKKAQNLSLIETQTSDN